MPGSEDRRPLAGIRVIDLSTFVTGGFATTMLSNQGASVIKVERPGKGDDIRHSGPPFVQSEDYTGPGTSASPEGESPYYWTVNQGKQSIELNLKRESGRTILQELVRDADILIENFRPGTAQRLGVDYEATKEWNPQIIYCSISAFGDSGPWRDRPGYDLLIQGLSGLMSVTGEPERQPVKVGVPITDLITGMWASFGILNALYRRELTGEGDRVELGMLDATLPWLTKQAGKAFEDEETGRMGTKDPVLAPYQMYPTADGYLNVACGNQRLWETLCEAIHREDLITDDRFKSNGDRVEHMEALEEELTTVFSKKSTAAWTEILVEDHGLPVGPVHSVDEALANEQTKARDVVSSIHHPAVGDIPVIDHPLNYDNASTGFDGPPPLLGEHTMAILQDIGYSKEEIKGLIEDGAIPAENTPL